MNHISVSPELGIGYFNLANVNIQMNKFKEACELYNKTILKDPNYFDAYIRLAKVKLFINKPNGSLQCVKDAIEQKTRPTSRESGK